VAKDAADLADKWGTFALRYSKATKPMMVKLGAAIEKEFWKGPPKAGLVKGMKPVGKPWGVKQRIEGQTGVYVSYQGPVHWWNNGTSKHFVSASGISNPAGAQKQVSRSRGSGRFTKPRKAMLGPISPTGPVYQRSVMAGGMKGKDFWTGVKKKSAELSKEMASDSMHEEALKSRFGKD
jgi:hypothetical protein